VLEGKYHEVDKFSHEIVNKQGSLESTQMVLKKYELQVENLQEDLIHASLSSISIENHSFTLSFSQEVASDIVELVEEPQVTGEHGGNSYL
jgi:hypothetical protein